MAGDHLPWRFDDRLTVDQLRQQPGEVLGERCPGHPQLGDQLQPAVPTDRLDVPGVHRLVGRLAGQVQGGEHPPHGGDLETAIGIGHLRPREHPQRLAVGVHRWLSVDGEQLSRGDHPGGRSPGLQPVRRHDLIMVERDQGLLDRVQL
jgi:hypothetical protein